MLKKLGIMMVTDRSDYAQARASYEKAWAFGSWDAADRLAQVEH